MQYFIVRLPTLSLYISGIFLKIEVVGGGPLAVVVVVVVVVVAIHQSE